MHHKSIHFCKNLFLDERRKEASERSATKKRKTNLEEIKDIKEKKKRLVEEAHSLQSEADRLAEKAEETVKMIYQVHYTIKQPSLDIRGKIRRNKNIVCKTSRKKQKNKKMVC